MILNLQVGITTQYVFGDKKTTARMYIPNTSSGLGEEIYVTWFADTKTGYRARDVCYDALEYFSSLVKRDFLESGKTLNVFDDVVITLLYWKILEEVEY